MTEQIDKKEIAELTRELITIPSVTGTDDVRRALEFAQNWLKKAQIDAEMVCLHGVQNLIAEVGTDSGSCRNLLWVSHMDVAPAGNFFDWKHPPFFGYEEGDFLYGRGACDAKSCVASMLMALAKLKTEEKNLPGRIILMLSGVAESGNENGIEGMLQKYPGHFDAAIVGEATDMCIEIAQRGLRWIEIRLSGIASHAGRPSLGLNAIGEAGKILNAFNGYVFHQRNDIFESGAQQPSISVNKIHGGTQNNLLAEECRMIVDRRMIPGETEQSVMDEIKGIVRSAVDPRCRVEYRILGKGWDPYILDDNERIVRVLRSAYRDVMNTEPVVRGKGTCTDASRIFQQGIPVVIFGPGIPFESHISNEKVSMERIARMVGILVHSAQIFFLEH